MYISHTINFVFYFYLEKTLSEVFGITKLHKKGSWNIHFSTIFSSNALVLDTFYVKYCSVLA